MDRRMFMAGLAASGGICTIPALAQQRPGFGGPLLFSAGGKPGIMTLTSPFSYRDPNGLWWRVPKGGTTDGATIPSILWPIVGHPYQGPYLRAAVVHDWFCLTKVRDWRSTHLMFFHAMLSGGVTPAKAKLMYAAVYWGGPSWSEAERLRMAGLTANGTISPPPPPPIMPPPPPPPPPVVPHPGAEPPFSDAGATDVPPSESPDHFIWRHRLAEWQTQEEDRKRDEAQAAAWEAARPARDAVEAKRKADLIASLKEIAAKVEKDDPDVSQISSIVEAEGRAEDEIWRLR